MGKGNLLTRALFLIDAYQRNPCSEFRDPVLALENFALALEDSADLRQHVNN